MIAKQSNLPLIMLLTVVVELFFFLEGLIWYTKLSYLIM